VSALCLGGVDEPERRRPTGRAGRSLRRELGGGLRTVLGHRLLAPLAAAQVAVDFGTRLIGVTYMVFVVRELGISAATIGVVAASGAVSSVLGAWLAQATDGRWRPGLALAAGMAVLGAASLAIPAAAHAGVFALGLLFVHQLGDGGWVLYEVHAASLRQRSAPDALQGRVNGLFSVLDSTGALAGSVAGSVAGGVLGEWLGLEPTLWLGGALVLAGSAGLLASPVRRFAGEVAPG